jgi:hypothetical protein
LWLATILVKDHAERRLSGSLSLVLQRKRLSRDYAPPTRVDSQRDYFGGFIAGISPGPDLVILERDNVSTSISCKVDYESQVPPCSPPVIISKPCNGKPRALKFPICTVVDRNSNTVIAKSNRVTAPITRNVRNEAGMLVHLSPAL